MSLNTAMDLIKGVAAGKSMMNFLRPICVQNRREPFLNGLISPLLYGEESHLLEQIFSKNSHFGDT